MNEEGLSQHIERFGQQRILVIGDLMLDRFVYGKADRVSPEAPIPVLAASHETVVPGGAGNVARNIAALGGHVALVGVLGDDDAGRDFVRLLRNIARLEANLLTVANRPTTLKVRYVAGSQQLLRVDRETVEPISSEIEDRLIGRLKDEVPAANAVLLSDYAKGVLGPRLIAAAIELARMHKVPIVADPKTTDFSRYRGVTVLKPNARELSAATGLAVTNDVEVEIAARVALTRADAQSLLVTRSERGMSLITPEAGAIHLSARAREVFDVSGAGDTALAVLALALGARAPLADAAALANVASGIVVGKIGTALVHPDELVNALQAQKLESVEAKILTLHGAVDLVGRWRARGLRVGFTNGCFDLIHPGHVSLLAQARAACDRLIVGLNSDHSVLNLKGEGRPVNTETARAIVLASLSSVDGVVIFEEPTPMRLIEAIRPDLLVKGADYTIETVVGSDLVRSYGGQVLLADLKPGHSTTGTIARLGQARKSS